MSEMDPVTKALRQSLGLEAKDEPPVKGRKYTSSGYVDEEKGIVSHYGVLIDATKPTTGVVSNGSIEFLEEEMFGGNAIDLAWEEHIAGCKGMCHECHCNHEDGECSCYFPQREIDNLGHDPRKHEYDPYEGEHDGCGPEERGTTLIGSWKKGEDGRWEPDESGEYAAIVGECNTQVVWSRFTKRAALCSPCYPGQADLDTEPGKYGDVLAYCLPPDLMGEGC